MSSIKSEILTHAQKHGQESNKKLLTQVYRHHKRTGEGIGSIFAKLATAGFKWLPSLFRGASSAAKYASTAAKSFGNSVGSTALSGLKRVGTTAKSFPSKVASEARYNVNKLKTNLGFNDYTADEASRKLGRALPGSKYSPLANYKGPIQKTLTQNQKDRLAARSGPLPRIVSPPKKIGLARPATVPTAHANVDYTEFTKRRQAQREALLKSSANGKYIPPYMLPSFDSTPKNTTVGSVQPLAMREANGFDRANQAEIKEALLNRYKPNPDRPVAISKTAPISQSNNDPVALKNRMTENGHMKKAAGVRTTKPAFGAQPVLGSSKATKQREGIAKIKHTFDLKAPVHLKGGRCMSTGSALKTIEKGGVIVRENGEYKLLSHKGKNLGTFSTESQAKNRERQVEYFKNAKTSKA